MSINEIEYEKLYLENKNLNIAIKYAIKNYKKAMLGIGILAFSSILISFLGLFFYYGVVLFLEIFGVRNIEFVNEPKYFFQKIIFLYFSTSIIFYINAYLKICTQMKRKIIHSP